MRINWKKWPDIKGFLKDNGLTMTSRPKKSFPEGTKRRLFILSFTNGVVLGAVERMFYPNGGVEYLSVVNYNYDNGLQVAYHVSHANLALAIKEIVTSAATYFLKDGSSSEVQFFKGKKLADGPIMLSKNRVILDGDGKPDRFND